MPVSFADQVLDNSHGTCYSCSTASQIPSIYHGCPAARPSCRPIVPPACGKSAVGSRIMGTGFDSIKQKGSSQAKRASSSTQKGLFVYLFHNEWYFQFDVIKPFFKIGIGMLQDLPLQPAVVRTLGQRLKRCVTW